MITYSLLTKLKFLGLCLGLLLPLRLHAQADAITVLRDEALVVSVTAQAPAWLIFEAEGGEIIDILTRALPDEDAEADSLLLDSVVSVWGPNLRQIAYNDDTQLLEADGSVNIVRDARLLQLRLKRGGAYLIRVDSFNGVSTGDVEVLLRDSAPFDERIIEEDNRTQISLTLPARMTYSYRFRAEAGQLLQITVQDAGRNLDPLLLLRDAEGAILGFNDDHNSRSLDLNVLDSRLRIDVPANGIYTLEAWDFLGAAGALEITLLTEE